MFVRKLSDAIWMVNNRLQGELDAYIIGRLGDFARQDQEEYLRERRKAKKHYQEQKAKKAWEEKKKMQEFVEERLRQTKSGLPS